MSKKIKKERDGVMYSTDPGFEFESEFEESETLPPAQQKLIIRLETKQRGGKRATLVKGFVGKIDDLENLCKKLKTHIGTGGSVVNGEILIQGEQIAKVKAFLQSQGYKTNNI